MALVKVKEVIGTSPNSFDEALKEAIKEICQQKQNVSGVKIVGMTVDIKNGEISQYKVNVKYAYRWEKELQQK
jgi:hypothetical protein